MPRVVFSLRLRAAAIGIVGITTLACDRAVAPRRNRLTELRQAATAGFGVFYGRVRAFDPSQSCWKAPQTLAGIRVEVGSPAFYRDTLTQAVPTSLAEPPPERPTGVAAARRGADCSTVSNSLHSTLNQRHAHSGR
jgi:hypothetical protein